MKARIVNFTVNYDLVERMCKSGIATPNIPNAMIREMNDSFEEISGKSAAICYMNKDYDAIANEDIDKSIKRFKNTMKRGHQSVADHCYISVVFEEVPKIFAMIMNSFQVYATSEKSARYTVMKNLSDEEQRLYDKWLGKLTPIFIEEGLDEKSAVKMAQENARYFISIFSPATTFQYTTSFRQWNYINDWFNKLLNDDEFMTLNEKYDSYNIFKSNVAECMEDFTEWFEKSYIYDENIKDQKNRKIDFIKLVYNHFTPHHHGDIIDYFGDVYQTTYVASFATLAQLQRHRTLKYSIYDFPEFNIDVLNGDYKTRHLFNVFIPDVFDTPERISLSEEWFSDMRSILHLFPQGLTVIVKEMGTVDDFLLKCDERLCGRTQYETMMICKDILYKMMHESDYLTSNETVDQLYNWSSHDVGSDNINPKCKMRGGCPDGGCFHGPERALNRKF